MKSGIGDFVRAPGYRPSLRTDLRFYKDETKGIVSVHDPVRDRRFQLYDSECLIAREMNGARDLDELTRAAKQHVPWATRGQVESLAVQIAGMGLLSNVPPALLERRPSANAIPIQRSEDDAFNHSDGLDDWTELSDGGPDALRKPLVRPPESGTQPAKTPAPGQPPSRPTPRPMAAQPPSRPTPPPMAAQPPSRPTPPPMAAATPHPHVRPSAPAIPVVAQQQPAPQPVEMQPRRATAAYGSPQVPVPAAPEQVPTSVPQPRQMPAGSTREAVPDIEPSFAAQTVAVAPAYNPPPADSPPAYQPAQETAYQPAQDAAYQPAQDAAPEAASDADPGHAAEESGEPPADQRAWEVERPSFFARHRTLVYVSLLVLVIGSLAVIPYPLYVTEPSTVIPAQRAQVRAQVEGLVAEVLVREGDLVKVGTPLVKLDDGDLTYALAQATADTERLAAALDKVKSGKRPEEIRRAETLVHTREKDLAFAGLEAARQQKLFVQGVASAAQRDEARRDLELKRSALAETQAELKLVKSGSRSEEVTIADAEYRRAQAEVTFLKRKIGLLTIRSPIEGRVLTPRFHEKLHAHVRAGDELCEIGSSEKMQVEVFVDEADADVIATGQQVKVKVRSYPLEVFEGKINLIASAVTVEDGRRIVRVEATLDNSSGLLRPRMTGYAEINAGTRTVLSRMLRRAVRWVRVRFLI